jgi:predicted dehydrogenase
VRFRPSLLLGPSGRPRISSQGLQHPLFLDALHEPLQRINLQSLLADLALHLRNTTGVQVLKARFTSAYRSTRPRFAASRHEHELFSPLVTNLSAGVVASDDMTLPPVAVVGVGAFGVNHLRVIHQSKHAQLSGVFDIDTQRAVEVAGSYGCRVFGSLEELAKHSAGAVVATPTSTHSEIGCALMNLGVDLLIEKPLALDPDSGRRLLQTSNQTSRLLHNGLLERYNPAVAELANKVTRPLFFEVHRLSAFTPRSLDVDVVLDLMIHDIDVVLSLVKERPSSIWAAGVSILTGKIDLANVRLEFPSGCIANLTASRVHTESVRKLRVFQPHEYLSLDYTNRELTCCRATPTGIEYTSIPARSEEPLKIELEEFFDSIKSRRPPRVTAEQALAALQVATEIRAAISSHNGKVLQAAAGSSQEASGAGNHTGGPFLIDT